MCVLPLSVRVWNFGSGMQWNWLTGSSSKHSVLANPELWDAAFIPVCMEISAVWSCAICLFHHNPKLKHSTFQLNIWSCCWEKPGCRWDSSASVGRVSCSCSPQCFSCSLQGAGRWSCWSVPLWAFVLYSHCWDKEGCAEFSLGIARNISPWLSELQFKAGHGLCLRINLHILSLQLMCTWLLEKMTIGVQIWMLAGN